MLFPSIGPPGGGRCRRLSFSFPFARHFCIIVGILSVAGEVLMEVSRGKVLLIDDDPFFLKILSDAFIECGFTVFTANDGMEGVSLFPDLSPDVVISDFVMPRMGGVSTCMEIARLAGDREPVIVLLTSMFQGEAREHEQPEMGARFHIPKSTKPLDIVIIVEQLLDRSRHRLSAGQ
jgi:two-component system OmpR family response regulator